MNISRQLEQSKTQNYKELQYSVFVVVVVDVSNIKIILNVNPF